MAWCKPYVADIIPHGQQNNITPHCSNFAFSINYAARE